MQYYMKIILASGSPRRKELLTRMGLTFDVVPSQFEEQLDDSRSPEEVALELAIGKGQEVAARYPDAYVISSDEIMVLEGKQLGKSGSRQEAEAMLRSFAGRTHDIYTSVVITNRQKNIAVSGFETAKVFFKSYDEKLMQAYLDSGDWQDKAGSYGIQSGAGPLISHIDGHADTIIGLPTHLLAQLLQPLGINAQPVEYELTLG